MEINISTSYPFLLAPSIMLRTALLLDLGVSDLSDSEGADRFSVDLLSAACDQEYQESINQYISYTTPPPNIQFPANHYSLDNSFFSFQNVSGETNRPGCSWSSVWSRHCSALPVRSAWTAPPGTTLLSPPSAPCKHNEWTQQTSRVFLNEKSTKTLRYHELVRYTCRVHKVKCKAF